MVARKGVVLAGGTGTRLRPYTYAINKHLLPVFDRPMVAYPIETLRRLGAREICVVTGAEDLEDFRKVLGDGSRFQTSLKFQAQDGPRGVAHALLQAEGFFQDSKVLAILGDDLFDAVQLEDAVFEDDFAYVHLAKATDPRQVAIAELDAAGTVLRIEEKPEHPRSEMMVVGLYVFPRDVFDVVRGIRPSARGELEISSVTDWYVRRHRLRSILTDQFVADMGSEEGLKTATLFAAKRSGYLRG